MGGRKNHGEKQIMHAEIKGYRLIACSSQGRCLNCANAADDLFEEIEALLKQEDLLGFLRRTVGHAVKPHHAFRISLAECPNACSQPQIKDIGIIGACLPQISDATCTHCNVCVEACRENAVCLEPEAAGPVINADLCLACGACAKACPTGTIIDGKKGWRVMLGGKLGRHPRLARELAGIFSRDQVIDIAKRCIIFYKNTSTKGARFADIYTRPEFIGLAHEKHPDRKK